MACKPCAQRAARMKQAALDAANGNKKATPVSGSQYAAAVAAGKIVTKK